MIIPYQETGRTRIEHCSNRHKIFEKDDIYSCIFKFSSKENFSWILLENLSIPGTFSLGFSCFGCTYKY